MKERLKKGMFYSRQDLLKISPLPNWVALNLGCGMIRLKDHINIDINKTPATDLVIDLEKGIPFEDKCVDSVYAHHFFEHIENIVFLMEELQRVCRKGAIIKIVVPYCNSTRAFDDPTHRHFFSENSFNYFLAGKVYGYYIKCAFAIKTISYSYNRIARIMPFKRFLRRFFWNMAEMMTVELEVRDDIYPRRCLS